MKGLYVVAAVTMAGVSAVFALLAELQQRYGLSTASLGWIGGAALWGFAVSQLVFAPLADSLGMRALLRLSFVGHLVGTITMIFATGFSTLFVGALIIAMGNGLVEAGCGYEIITAGNGTFG